MHLHVSVYVCTSVCIYLHLRVYVVQTYLHIYIYIVCISIYIPAQLLTVEKKAASITNKYKYGCLDRFPRLQTPGTHSIGWLLVQLL